MPRQVLARSAQRRQAEEYISQKEAARRAGCSLSTIHRACLRFQATFGRDGLSVTRRSWRMVRIPLSDFDRWMRGETVPLYRPDGVSGRLVFCG